MSSLFILAAAIQPFRLPAYCHFIVCGLAFSFGGDVFLAFPSDGMFKAGLFSFLLGHVFYAVAFFRISDIESISWLSPLFLVAIGAWIYFWVEPRLGKMKIPVIAYIIVISLMLWGAVSVLFTPGLTVAGKTMAFSGALLFYVSDIFVARHRFVANSYSNLAIGLPIYYSGQFLLAFSTGAMAYV